AAQEDRTRPKESPLHQNRLGRRLHVRRRSRIRMRFWPRNWWPRTLGAQLVVVAAGAVIASNAAVGIWFATTQERMTESYITGRLLDRAVSAATLLSGIAAH